MIGFWNKRRNRIAAGKANARRSLLRDDSGATILEFTIVAAPFIALIFANLVTALAMFSQQMLDTTTEKMSRQLMTGQVQKAGTNEANFKQAVCNDLPPFLSCDRVMVSVQKVADFSAADTSAATIEFDEDGEVINEWDYEAGDPGDIVLMQVYYRWPSFFGPLGFSIGNLSNGERLLVSTAIFKTEQYL